MVNRAYRSGSVRRMRRARHVANTRAAALQILAARAAAGGQEPLSAVAGR
ncbi:hypothetical protein [Streptomyces nodosus]